MSRWARAAGYAALACVLVMGMTACGESDDSSEPAGSALQDAPGTTYDIGMVQIVSDPVLNNVQKGVRDGLARIGRQRGVQFNIDFKNAQGELPNGQTIAQQFVQSDKDLIVGIGTPVIVSAAKVTKDIPIVFAGMTDPVGAGVAESRERPGGNLTGTSDYVDPARNIEVITQVVPNAKSVGTILNQSEANSVSWGNAFKKAARAARLEPIIVGVGNSGEVQSAALSMADRVDAILIGADNTALGATATIAKIGLQAKKPVFSVASEAAERGALVGMGLDNYDIGRKTANIAASILMDGKDPATIPVASLPNLEITVNDQTARKLGIAIPPALREAA